MTALESVVEFFKMGKNAKKRNRNTKRPKGAYQSTDDGDEKPSFGRNKRNTKPYGHNNKPKYDFDDDYTKLRKTLDADGLEIVEMNPDGNCLFRSLSDQLFGDNGDAHFDMRSSVCDFMEKNKSDFQVFLVFEDEDDEDQDEEDAKDFEHYIESMRQQGEWGGNLEVVAAARLYRRTITVYSETLSAFAIDHGDSRSMGSDLLVSYHDNDHYNSVRKKLHSLKSSRVEPPTRNGETDIQIQNNKHMNQGSSETENVSSSLSKLVITDEFETNEITIQKNVKRSAKCPCGSGLRYKKCCLAKQKQATRMEKLKGMRQVEEDDLSELNEDKRSPNMFRVVTI